MLFYFKVAERFGIIDKPNQRSSHTIPTVRGGGIVFALAVFLWFFQYGFNYPYFIIGLALIAAISFADDIQEQPPLFRFAVHFIAFLFLAYEIQLYQIELGVAIAILIVSIGAINAFNFMDGINGISGIYGLVNFISFFLIDWFVFPFTQEILLIYSILATIIFLYFNFRKKARCFAGDIGSLTLAFVQIFFCLQLIIATGSYAWVLLFLLYGLDAVTTIIYRLKRKENIFRPHRSHLYQYLANELNIQHRIISVAYGFLQGMVNIFLILLFPKISGTMVIVIILVAGLLTITIREYILKKISLRSKIQRLDIN